jgi:poly-gamma-glutamate synthesis protein (capsule biosynthesis protein)
MTPDEAGSICLFLCGDVMTGRGIDQILPHPGDPTLYERHVRDARDYVRLAEAAGGPIRRPVDLSYVWGDALEELRRADARIVNLETSVTTSDDPWPGKAVHYRMNPNNVSCLTAAGIDCCCLANNHVLDWGYPGLDETLRTLDGAGIARAGAGWDAAEAASPAVLDSGKGRVLVLALGSASSGIPYAWAATQSQPGVNLPPFLSEDAARTVTDQLRRLRRPGDVAVASIHWGGNWGHDVPAAQTDFAHRLVEGGIDVVHGHSSHHVKAVEVYRGRLILYGSGDFLTDYEGIGGHERFRGELALAYFVRVDPREGRLVGARLVPFRSRRFRLGRVRGEDAAWLCGLLNRLGEPFGTRAELEGDDSMTLRWR